MKILLLSNQGMIDGIVGNPIMLRMRDTLKTDPRIEDVEMLRCKEPFSVCKELRKKAQGVDVIHLHFGGVYALVVWFLLFGIKKPKIITFHGTDIHAKALNTAKDWKERLKIRLNQRASFLCIRLYDRCGFVASEMMDYVPGCLRKTLNKKSFIQRLGVDYNKFIIEDKNKAQAKLNLEIGKYALFSDISGTKIKRRDIASLIVRKLGDEYNLLIMCGVNPSVVPDYINACDFVLLTSDEEGSPNIIREALALNKPVFSVEVGDAVQQLKGLNNSTIISRVPDKAVETIKEYLNKTYIDNSRETRREIIDFVSCNSEIIDIYESSLTS